MSSRQVPLLLIALVGLTVLLAAAFLWWTGADESTATTDASADRESASETVPAPAPVAGARERAVERVAIAAAGAAEATAESQERATSAEHGVRVTGRVLCRDVDPADLRVRLASRRADSKDRSNLAERLQQPGADLAWRGKATSREQQALPLAEDSTYAILLDPRETEADRIWRVEVSWLPDLNSSAFFLQQSVLVGFSRPFLLPAEGKQKVEDLVADLPVIVRARADASRAGGTADGFDPFVGWSVVVSEGSGTTGETWRRPLPTRRAPWGQEVMLLLPPTTAAQRARVLAGIGMLEIASREESLRPGMNDFGTLALPAPAWIHGQVLHVQGRQPVEGHPVSLQQLPDYAATPWRGGTSSTEAATDAAGRFAFGPLSAGRYEVRAHKKPGEHVAGLTGNNVTEEVELASGDGRSLEVTIGQRLCKLTVRLEGLPPGCSCTMLAVPEGGTVNDVALGRGNPAVFEVDPSRRTLLRSVAPWGGGSRSRVFFAAEWGPSPETEASLTIQLAPTRLEMPIPPHDQFVQLVLAPQGVRIDELDFEDFTALQQVHEAVIEAGTESVPLIGLPPGVYTVRMRSMSGAESWDPADPSVEEWTVEVR